MLMPGRSYSSNSYRFGFNGKENDNEVKGTGNQQDYGMRIYDPRIIRFNSVDPLTASYPMLTPYQFASNNPIWAIDLDGLEAWYTNSGSDQPTDVSGPTKSGAGPLTTSTATDMGFSQYGIMEDNNSFTSQDVERLKQFGESSTSTDCWVTQRGAAATLLNDNSINKIGWSKDKSLAETLDEKGKIAKTLTVDWNFNKMKKVGPNLYNSGFDKNLTDVALQTVGNEKGIFGFGLTIGGGYHTMTMILDNTSSSPNISLLDNETGWSPKLKLTSAGKVSGIMNTVSLGARAYYLKKNPTGNFDRESLGLFQYRSGNKSEVLHPIR